MKEAKFYKGEGEKLHCYLCPHHCKIPNGQKGLCSVRKNMDGMLYSTNYGQISSINGDPIEKKPLYHFMEGTTTLSIGSFGCNLACEFCQNYTIAKEIPKVIAMKPEEIVNLALEYHYPSISYTYNEPTIYFEYMYDIAVIAKSKGLKNIMVTNGYIGEEPLNSLLPYIDAMNIDLKSYNDYNYKKICQGSLEPVKRTIIEATKNCHVEVTTLLVTNMNDKEEELIEEFSWLASVNPDIPLHLSRYFPRYHYHEATTDLEFMRKIYYKAKAYLNHVYLGNV